ncbi:MAG: DUF2298 domain-containing protein [Anaerolineae bacterium]
MRWLRRRRIALGLALILVIGAALRFYGLNWDQNHHLHPDERWITMVATRLDIPPLQEWPRFFNPALAAQATERDPNFFAPQTSPLNPRFFAYGSLPLYLLRLAAHLLSLLAPLSRLFSFWPSLAQALAALKGISDYDHLTLLGRVISALLGTANIYLTYLVGKRVHGSKVGLLAATFSAFTVFQIQVAHFYAVDVILLFFTLLFFYFALGLAKGGGVREAVLLGVTLGLALATKFSAAPLVLAFLGAFLLRWRAQKGWKENAILLLLSLLFLALAFFVAQPYAILDWKTFAGDVVEQGEMVRGIRDYPYTRQYTGTTPFLYQITQTILWAMGPPLGVLAWCGFLFALWRGLRWRGPWELLLLAWTVPYFLTTGSFYVKFLRYMLPLFPFFYIMAANMLFAWQESLKANWWGRALWYVACGFVILCSLLYSLAFESIYARPHSRVQASEWIYRHIPSHSVLAEEHWDDDLPLGMRVDGEPRSINEYRTVTMALYEPDDEAKYQEIVDNLRETDYIILSSNRLYGSIPRLPQRYPITTRYYELLFDEELGFRLVKAFTSYPGLFGLPIVDDRADESFTVYDHPKVLIFQKRRDLRDEEFADLFAEALEPSPERPSGKTLLLDEPVDELPVIRDRGWNRLANSHPLLSILFWWLAVEMLGLAALPLTLLVFHHLADGGYILSKTLGLLVVAYLVWLAASLRLFTNSLPTILGAGLLLGLASFSLLLRGRQEIIALLSSRKGTIFISEAVFSCAFLLFVGIRLLNPDLWQPWNGGEKSMEFAYLNAIVKSPYFPPYDPYFAGGYINYYYYGLHLVSILIKLTGIVPQVAFNLAIPTLFALTVGNAFSLGYNLTRKYLWGVVAPVFLAFLGNLDGLVQIVERLGDLGGLEFRSPIPGVEGLVRAVPGLLQLLLGRGALPPFDYWRSTRVIPFTINEFPFFSFLFADLHPHMIGIPFTIFLLALVFAWRRRSGQDGLFSLDSLVLVLFLGLSLGGVAVINTWDLPTYFLIILGAFLLRAWAQGGAWATAKALSASLGIVVLGLLLYLPFFSYYQPLHVGLGLVRRRTGIEPFLTIWGFFVFLIGSYLLLSVRRRLRGREALLAFGSVSLAILVFLLLKEWVLALLFPLLILAGILILSDDSQPERGFIHLLGFLGLGILLGCEVVYLRDFLQGGDYRRMNTIFKFYIQAWVLLSVAGAAVLPQLWRCLRGVMWRRLWQGAFLALFLASSIYTVFGTQARVRDRFPGARPPLGTLDGLAFMTVGRYTWPDESNPIELRYDYEAIQWFLANVEGTPVVAEAALPYYREGGLRVASYTGLPTLVGAHQNEQRYGWMVAQREAEARSLYESTDLQETKALLEELDIRYIYVGQLERTVYPARSLAKFDTLLEEGYLELAYQNPRVRVYKVKG